MLRILLLICIASVFACVPGCSSGNGLPPDATIALQEATSFELLSLDPGQSQNPDRRDSQTEADRLHGWIVLGTTAIQDSNTRATLVSRFAAGVAEHNGMVASCFNPRHAIKLIHDGKTHVFVICFECAQVEWYIDGQETNGFLIAVSPQPMFDEVLQKANVPLAEKSKH